MLSFTIIIINISLFVKHPCSVLVIVHRLQPLGVVQKGWVPPHIRSRSVDGGLASGGRTCAFLLPITTVMHSHQNLIDYEMLRL
jgi:hypothetical protein